MSAETSHSNGPIAAALEASLHTVQLHIADVYLAIGTHNEADTTAYALSRRLA